MGKPVSQKRLVLKLIGLCIGLVCGGRFALTEVNHSFKFVFGLVQVAILPILIVDTVRKLRTTMKLA